MRKTAARKTTLQMVQGFLSKKKLVRYRTMNMAWLYIKAGFNGLGMRRTGMSHCKQYISAGYSSDVFVAPCCCEELYFEFQSVFTFYNPQFDPTTVVSFFFVDFQLRCIIFFCTVPISSFCLVFLQVRIGQTKRNQLPITVYMVQQ